jgi:hypothetical protein
MLLFAVILLFVFAFAWVRLFSDLRWPRWCMYLGLAWWLGEITTLAWDNSDAILQAAKAWGPPSAWFLLCTVVPVVILWACYLVGPSLLNRRYPKRTYELSRDKFGGVFENAFTLARFRSLPLRTQIRADQPTHVDNSGLENNHIHAPLLSFDPIVLLPQDREFNLNSPRIMACIGRCKPSEHHLQGAVQWKDNRITTSRLLISVWKCARCSTLRWMVITDVVAEGVTFHEDTMTNDSDNWISQCGGDRFAGYLRWDDDDILDSHWCTKTNASIGAHRCPHFKFCRNEQVWGLLEITVQYKIRSRPGFRGLMRLNLWQCLAGSCRTVGIIQTDELLWRARHQWIIVATCFVVFASIFAYRIAPAAIPSN